MAASDAFVIVGAGLAGAKAAEALRDQEFDGAITLIGAEEHLPYERPPLSKGYLNGSESRESFIVHPADWYVQHRVHLLTGVTAESLDRSGHRVTLRGGEAVPYDKLLLATGSRPRSLPIPGADADGVHMLRSVEESETLASVFKSARQVVVIGAGWIGLETTAAARQADTEVTVIESAELPLLRVLGPEVAQVFADLHRAHGVDLRLGASLAEITTDAGRATGVALKDGTTIAADAVIVGVGVQPNVELAEAAGLSVDNGVLVDASMRSSDPDVFAVGDVANAEHPLLGQRIRVEHWANALKQPAVAATAMLGGEATYDDLPYFFTDQYDLGMEYVGYVSPGDYDEVVIRGDTSKREFIAFWTKDRRVLAGMNVNVWDVVDPIKALIRSQRPLDLVRLADSSVPLTEV